MIPIENKTDWNAIRAEYIGGGISQRKLAAKHGVSWRTLQDRAKREGWNSAKDDTRVKAVMMTCQKTAEAAADNAAVAERIRTKLLLRLERIEEKIPMDATEVQIYDKGKRVTFRVRELSAMYKDLTDDKIDVNVNMAKFDALEEAFKAIKDDAE